MLQAILAAWSEFAMALPPAAEATETDVAAPGPAVAGAPPETDEIEYPEGNWIAQSVAHSDASSLAKAALRLHFQHRDDALVAMELIVYYQQGNVSAWLQPDVLVAFGVRQLARRSTFKVWEEGKAPDFVLEVASPSTAGRDARHKALEYARIRVREYWRLDPHGSLMESPLEGYEARGGKYSPLRPVASPAGAGWLRSRVLGLDLRSRTVERGTTVVFRDPQTGKEFDGALEEAERRRQAEKDRADAEVEGRRAAEEVATKEAERASREAEGRRAAEEQVRALKKQLRNLASHGPPPEPES